MWLHFIVILPFIRGISTDCSLVLNEVNTNWQDKDTLDKSSIELKLVDCRPKEKPPMKRFSVLGVTFEKDSKSKCSKSITFVANLYHAKMAVDSDFYVFGSDSYAKNQKYTVDMPFSQSTVQSRHKCHFMGDS